MQYKGIDIDVNKLNMPFTLNDVPMHTLKRYEDVVPWEDNESPPSYRQRVVSKLNNLRGQIASYMAAHVHNEDKRALQSTNYDNNPGIRYFKRAGNGDYLKLNKEGNPRTFTTLDIETDDRGRPITISALKQVFNQETGLFETIDNYQRFYRAHNKDLVRSSQVHGLTSRKLSRLRGQQKAFYSRSYNNAEANELKQFLGDSILVGHNIVDFDLPHLFETPLSNQTIDTLTASRNQWEGRKNDLDSVFQRLYGKTMEQAGLSHHDSMADVLATALIAQKLLSRKGATGDALRYVAKHPGTHIAPLDRQVGAQVIQGLYNEYKQTGRYVSMKDYDGTEVSIEELMGGKSKLSMSYNEETGEKELPAGMSYADVSDTDHDIVSDIAMFSSTLSEVGKDIKKAAQINGEWAQHMEAAMSVRNFADMRQFRLRASSIDDPKQRLEYIRASGYGDNEAQRIMQGTDVLASMRRERDNHKFEEWKALQMSRRERRGIQDEDREKLHATKSYSEFIDAADEIDLRMQRITRTFQAFNTIPLYNFERLEQAFKGQIGGITSAARGVIPNFLYSPFSRMMNGGMNALTAHYAPLKYGVRAGSVIGGAAFTAGLGLTASGVGAVAGVPLMAAGGLIGATSQIAGNAGEAKIVRWGENIQNNLNTVGLVTDLALMPIRLLGEAVKGAIKNLNTLKSAFGGVAYFMSGSLGTLTRMSNPLTGLTNVGYGGYIGSTSADFASLLGEGTINGMYNDFATQRMQLYTTGAINTNRLVAASMLGIYSSVYGPVVDEEEAVAEAVNKLRAQSRGQSPRERKRIYMLAGQVSPHLSNILQTMDTLGIDDFNELKRPKGMFGYSEDTLDRYRARFQKAQWEYRYAGSQKDITMQRISTMLWNGGTGTFGLSGKWLYNSFNSVMSSVAGALESGNWNDVISHIKELWKTLKQGVNSTWEIIKKAFNIKSDLGFGEFLKKTLLDKLADSVEYFRDEILPRVYNVWDLIVSYSIDKLTNLLEFLSTIRIDFDEFKKQVIQGKEGDKPWIVSAASSYDYKKEHQKNFTWRAYKDDDFSANYHPRTRDDMAYADDRVYVDDRMYTAVRSSRAFTPEVIKESFGTASQMWAVDAKDAMKTTWNRLFAYLSENNVKLLNEDLEELFNVKGIDVSPVIGDAEAQGDFLEMLSKIQDKHMSPYALAAIEKYSKFFKGLDPHDSKVNQRLHGVYDDTKDVRNAAAYAAATSIATGLRDLGDIPPKLIIEIIDADGNKQGYGIIREDGSTITGRYNGDVDIFGQDGVYRFQRNQSTKNVGY